MVINIILILAKYKLYSIKNSYLLEKADEAFLIVPCSSLTCLRGFKNGNLFLNHFRVSRYVLARMKFNINEIGE